MPLRSTSRSPLVSQVIDQLREQITSGEWPVGSRIPPEPRLAADLGVGRNTLREAVRALSHAGLLECRQGAGTFVRAARELTGPLVRSLDGAALRHVLEVRRALEVEAARLAAQRRTAPDVTAMSRALATREAAWHAGDPTPWVEADARFHETVVAASHNPVLTELYRDFGDALRASLHGAVGADLTPDAYRDHLGLLTAIRDGDPERAAREAAGFLDESLRLADG